MARRYEFYVLRGKNNISRVREANEGDIVLATSERSERVRYCSCHGEHKIHIFNIIICLPCLENSAEKKTVLVGDGTFIGKHARYAMQVSFKS